MADTTVATCRHCGTRIVYAGDRLGATWRHTEEPPADGWGHAPTPQVMTVVLDDTVAEVDPNPDPAAAWQPLDAPGDGLRLLADCLDPGDPDHTVGDHVAPLAAAEHLRDVAARLDAAQALTASGALGRPVFQLVQPGTVVVVTLPDGMPAWDADHVTTVAAAVADMLGAEGTAVLPHGTTLATLDDEQLQRMGLVSTRNTSGTWARYSALAQVLTDLDRCEHGRHEGDPCSGAGGCDGPSRGNPILGTATRRQRSTLPRQVGYSMDGTPIVVPDGRHLHDPDAWRRKPEAGTDG